MIFHLLEESSVIRMVSCWRYGIRLYLTSKDRPMAFDKNRGLDKARNAEKWGLARFGSGASTKRHSEAIMSQLSVWAFSWFAASVSVLLEGKIFASP